MRKFEAISNDEIKQLQEDKKLSHFLPLNLKIKYSKCTDECGNISIFKDPTNFSHIHVADILPLL